MRTTIIYISLLGSLFLFSQTFDWFGAFVMFTLFGIVPGMSDPLSANYMLTIYLGIASLSIVFYARELLTNLSKSFFGKRSVS